MNSTLEIAETLVLSSTASVGAVGLIVSDLQRSLDFYGGVIGLDLLTQTGMSAQLGVGGEGRVLLELEQRPGVRPLRQRRLGLYHTGLLLPSRADLASFAEHLHRRGVRAASSDHLVSEALYLEDPDGLTIEVYADRERHLWPWQGEQLAVATLPLDVADLLATPHGLWQGIPRGSSMGHVHLYIGDLKMAERLYRHGLGLTVRTQGFPGALFLAAGGYHHHVGLNTWAGPVPAASENDPRLSRWELQVPQNQIGTLTEQMSASGWQPGTKSTFVDPWGIHLRLVGGEPRGRKQALHVRAVPECSRKG